MVRRPEWVTSIGRADPVEQFGQIFLEDCIRRRVGPASVPGDISADSPAIPPGLRRDIARLCRGKQAGESVSVVHGRPGSP